MSVNKDTFDHSVRKWMIKQKAFITQMNDKNDFLIQSQDIFIQIPMTKMFSNLEIILNSIIENLCWKLTMLQMQIINLKSHF